jgi:hypothetical protein
MLITAVIAAAAAAIIIFLFFMVLSSLFLSNNYGKDTSYWFRHPVLSFFPVCRFFSGTGGWAVPDFPPALTFTGFSSFVPPAFTFAGFRPFDSPPAPEPGGL